MDWNWVHTWAINAWQFAGINKNNNPKVTNNYTFIVSTESFISSHRLWDYCIIKSQFYRYSLKDMAIYDAGKV